MCDHSLSWKCVAHEHDPTVWGVANTSAATGDRTHLEFEQVSVVTARHRPHTRGGGEEFWNRGWWQGAEF